MTFDFEIWAIRSYNQFRLLQPQIGERGLYRIGSSFQILCPSLTTSTKTNDGKSLVTWFNNEVRQIITPVSLAPSLPAGAVRVRELTSVEMASCAGGTHTLRDVYADLAVELPSDFPQYYIHDEPGHITVVVSRTLTAEEEQRLRETLERIRLAASWSISTSPTPLKKADEFQRAPQGDLDLLPARSAAMRGWSKDLSHLIRRDEETWMEYRAQLPRINSKARLLEGSFADSSARCLINAATFPTKDIRNYLSIYQKVAIIAPLDKTIDQFYRSANLTEDELIELAQIGRVEIICPHASDRYPVRLLEKLASSAPASLLLSRRLALATAVDSRHRIPLLYPDLTIKERVELLRSLLKAAARLKDPKQAAVLDAFVRDIGRIWNSTEDLLHRRGAMANAALGITFPMNRMFEAAGLPPRDAELMSAAMTVEWAGAITATVQPIEASGYDERPYTEVIANLYTGLKMGEAPSCAPSSNVRVSDVLAIGSNVPVVDFAKSFRSAEIERLRTCLHDLTLHQYRKDAVEDSVVAFNKEVSRYAGAAGRIERWDFMGLILTGAGALPPAATGVKEIATAGTIVSLGLWMINRLKRLIEDGMITDPTIMAWVETTLAALYSTTPEAILVQRLQQRLKPAGK